MDQRAIVETPLRGRRGEPDPTPPEETGSKATDRAQEAHQLMTNPSNTPTEIETLTAERDAAVVNADRLEARAAELAARAERDECKRLADHRDLVTRAAEQAREAADDADATLDAATLALITAAAAAVTADPDAVERALDEVSIRRLVRERDAARDERDAALGGEEVALALRAQVDRLRAERDAARAQVAALSAYAAREIAAGCSHDWAIVGGAESEEAQVRECRACGRTEVEPEPESVDVDTILENLAYIALVTDYEWATDECDLNDAAMQPVLARVGLRLNAEGVAVPVDSEEA